MEIFNNYYIKEIDSGSLACLNRNVLKYLVIILMVLDHVSFFMPPDSELTFVFQFFSRLTALIMCFFIAEGYFYTRSVKAYMKRLLIFAIISYVAYVFAFTGTLLPITIAQGNVIPHYGIYITSYVPQVAYYGFLNLFNLTLIVKESSMILTLFLGLLSIYVWDKWEMPIWSKFLVTIAIMFLASFSDYSYFAILYCLIFYFLKEKPIYKWTAFSIVSLLYIFNVTLLNPFTFTWTVEFMAFRFGVFLTPLLLLFYNGKPGKKSSFNKWFFYIFYPGHLLLIGLMGCLMGAFV